MERMKAAMKRIGQDKGTKEMTEFIYLFRNALFPAGTPLQLLN